MRKVIQGTGVPIPPVMRSRDKEFAKWANVVRKSIESLAKPQSVIPNHRHSQTPYPFRIQLNTTATSSSVRLCSGRVSCVKWDATDLALRSEELNVGYHGGSGPLLFDSFDTSTPGFLTLTNNTTFGVWCMVGMTSVVVSNPGEGSYYQIDTFFAFDANIAVSTVNIGFLSALSAAREFDDIRVDDKTTAAFYIGQLTPTTSILFDAKQWRKSDITISADSLPKNFHILPGEIDAGGVDDGYTMVSDTEVGSWVAPP